MDLGIKQKNKEIMDFKESEYYRKLMLNSDINYFWVVKNYDKISKIISNLWSRNERDSQTLNNELYSYNIKYYYGPLIDYWQSKADFYNLILQGAFVSREEVNEIALSFTRPYYTSPIY